YLPSSRAGLHLLYKEYFLSKGDIDFNKNQVIVDDSKDISHDSTLTKPLYNYLRFLQKWSFDNRTAKENQKLIDFLENRLIDGVYQKTENIEYIPNGSEESIPLYLSSSMISELIPYYYFICSKEYSITDYLMIDEAESSLHPKKQFELVRLLV
ncbi:ATP-binding protein, partial [Coprobacillus cateniformis]|nr:ATP-binding protein [Coprobacillus cateniformis]